LRPIPDTARVLEVSTRRLDDYDFHAVTFIKIDVEGHEREVLEGGRETIVRERPLLQIEIEQRHHDDSIDSVFSLVAGLGYEAYYLSGDDLIPLANRTCPKAVNNFLFRPRKPRR